MGFFREVEQPAAFQPFVALRETLGFVPNLFRAQTLLPRVIEAEARVAAAVLFNAGALSRIQKECILLKVAAAQRNAYCVAAHWQVLRGLGVPEERLERVVRAHRAAELPADDHALLDFSLRLSRHPTWVGARDLDTLRELGLTDRQILETVLVAALTEFLCTLSTGVGAVPDVTPPVAFDTAGAGDAAGAGATAGAGEAAGVRLGTAAEAPWDAPPPAGHAASAGPYLATAGLRPETFPPFAFFRERFGFIPGIFRAQTLCPDVLDAEAEMVGTVLLKEDLLTRTQKEYILLAISATNLNTYCVAVHCEMLRNLGIPDDLSDQIAVDHHLAGLSPADTALLDFALTLARRSAAFGADDIAGLLRHGFSEEQALEAVVMTALTRFLNTLQMGLGTRPDFRPRRAFPVERVNPRTAAAGPTDEAMGHLHGEGPEPDPDDDLVTLARARDAKAFGELVRRHAGRVHRTVFGIVRNAEDAEDAMQDALLRAYQSLDDFRGTARFSTWLTRIAVNAGLDKVRARKTHDSLDDLRDDAEDGEFQPRFVQAWGPAASPAASDDPERAHARAERRALVEAALLTLPLKYRLAVMLRDIQQMSTEEAAAALGLGVPTLKTRLLRGRLMLREELAPHFQRRPADAWRDGDA